MKKLIYVPLFVAVLGLAFAAFAQTQVQSGTWGADVNSVDYTLADNTGDRSITVSVEFPVPFETKPDVIVSVSHLDTNKDFNMRYSVSVLSVSRDAMTIKVRTWADTVIFGISGYWLAYAE